MCVRAIEAVSDPSRQCWNDPVHRVEQPDWHRGRSVPRRFRTLPILRRPGCHRHPRQGVAGAFRVGDVLRRSATGLNRICRVEFVNVDTAVFRID